MLEPVVLEAALAGLIANRAIHRMVQKQELLNGRACARHVLAALTLHLHTFHHGELTRGLKLRLLLVDVLSLFGVPSEDG